MKAVLSWSGGKDSSLSYYTAKRSKNCEIVALLTTVNSDYQRISMHGVRRELLKAQASALGIPLHEVMIPKGASNPVYEEETKRVVLDLKERRKISTAIFGDLFLQDIRSYRENFFGKLGISCEFPIWGKDTKKLASYFVEEGFRAIVCCLDPTKIPSWMCGREFDKSFLSELPAKADACGENGEFHTFVYDGPIFQKRIPVKTGETLQRDGFCFTDILLQ